jgi:hypothetical protein
VALRGSSATGGARHRRLTCLADTVAADGRTRAAVLAARRARLGAVAHAIAASTGTRRRSEVSTATAHRISPGGRWTSSLTRARGRTSQPRRVCDSVRGPGSAAGHVVARRA